MTPERITSSVGSLWQSIEKKSLPDYVWNSDPFTFWQERILFIICFAAVVFGPFALIPSVWLSVREGLISVAVLDICAYAACAGVILSRNLSLAVRSGMICSILYILGTGLLVILGPIGAGYLWLLFASIIVSMVYEIRAALFTLVCNAAALLIIAACIAAGMIHWPMQTDNLLEKWLVMTVNFILINTFLTVTTALMLRSLKFNFRKEQGMRQRLEESEARLHRVFDAVDSIPVQGYDRDRKVIFWNRASERVYGYTRDEAVGCRLEDLIIPDEMASGVIQAVTDWHERDIQIPAGELTLTDKAGRPVTVFSNHVMITNRNGEKEMFCIDLDLSEFKRIEAEKAGVEEQYRQAQKIESIGRLAGGVAHDLNNLLFPVIGYSEILLEELEKDDPRYGSVASILEAGMKSRDLVRQLLAFSRKQTLAVKPVDLNRIIADFDKLLRRTIREDVDLRLVLAPGRQMVQADTGQIEQVLMNLAVNAADAMPGGGILIIETRPAIVDDAYARDHQGALPGRYVLLSVSDTGGGMDEDTRSKIFEPFFSTKGTRGTGLGLATVYGIVKQHRGNIWVYSEPGRGTTFRIYLPAAEGIGGADRENPPVTGNLHGSETILLVEDDPSVRRLAEDLLKKKGYTVLAAAEGGRALSILARHASRVSLMLTDVIMPRINGRELYDQARKIDPNLKVLYMSGYTDDVIAHHGVLDPGVQFIQKPFTIDSLAARVRQVLDE